MTAFSDDPPNDASEKETRHPSSPIPAEQAPVSSAQGVLATALGAAVPLWIFEIAARGGPTADDWTRLQSLGRLLAERGDRLLFRSARAGETAELFNALAEALALLAFVPGGVPFGDERFDAFQILSGLLGEEQARSCFSQIHRMREE